MTKFILISFVLLACNSSKSLRNTHYGNKRSKPTTTETKTSYNSVNAPKTNVSSFIQQWLGVPYKWGGLSKSGIDCSGFVLKYYQNIYGQNLNRTASKQYKQGIFVNRSQLKKGDLVFFKGTTSNAGITHVGVYLENDTFVHASTSKGVTVSSLNNDYYNKHYAGAKRIIN